jgi:hypothetical protein
MTSGTLIQLMLIAVIAAVVLVLTGHSTDGGAVITALVGVIGAVTAGHFALSQVSPQITPKPEAAQTAQNSAPASSSH